MGLFDLLFKARADRTEEKRVESSEPKADPAPPDPTVFLVPRDRPPVAPAIPRSAPTDAMRSDSAASPTLRKIVVTFADVLSRIPAEFLKEDAKDLRSELRFGPDEFFADIPRGRVTVALSNIAAQCPEAFRLPVTDDDDREVRLPLQKVLDQLVGQEPGIVRSGRTTVEPPKDSPPVASSPATVDSEPTPKADLPVPLKPAEPPAVESVPAPVPEVSERTIRLSLATIVAGCPDDVFAGERPRVDDSVQVTLPFEPIERQLTSGTIEITGARFVASLPPPYGERVSLREGVKISLPLEEIFRNLPGRTEAPPTDEEAPAPTKQSEVSRVVENLPPPEPASVRVPVPVPADVSEPAVAPVEAASPESAPVSEALSPSPNVEVPEVAAPPPPEPIVPTSAPPSQFVAPEPPAPEAPVVAAAAISEPPPAAPFRFFAPARPMPHVIPPPPVHVGSIERDERAEVEATDPEPSETTAPIQPAAEASAAPPPVAADAPLVPPESSERPSLAPPLRALEVRPSVEATPAPETAAPTLHTAAPAPSQAAAAPSFTFHLSRPPVARPFVMLPPPIAGTNAADSVQGAAPNPPEAPLETTSDQTAVLEFLSGELDAEQKK